jgi:hypothetical protein
MLDNRTGLENGKGLENKTGPLNEIGLVNEIVSVENKSLTREIKRWADCRENEGAPVPWVIQISQDNQPALDRGHLALQ